MKKVVFRGSCSVFPNPGTVFAVILLTAIICVPACIVGAAYAKADGQITTLGTAITDSK